ncbi:MAG TPA: transglutaminase-like domain-containing protein, partial [Christiangramia sp.]|nr:transglutaminase-like domain-containing protein [Christiangramia sp.]
NEFPYQIEYSYVVSEEEYLYIAWWTPIIFENTSTIHSSLEIDIPSNLEIQMDQTGKAAMISDTSKENRKILKWQSAGKLDFEHEIFSPTIRERIPKVVVVPSNFKYGTEGSFRSWNSFGSWIHELNLGQDELTPKEKSIVEKLVDGIEDPKEITRKIYHYLQDHTKYVNVAIDIGGLKTYPASYVCRNKYGDCKALTTYMKAMLKSVEIDSYYTVINAGEDGSRIKTDFPSQQFNHVVLAVPFEKDTIWLENTSNINPFGYLGTFTQNRYALAVNGEKSELVRTPKLIPEKVLSQRNYEYFIENEDSWKTNIEFELRGKDFEDFRYYIRNRDEEDQRSALLNQGNIQKFKILNWNVLNDQRDQTSVKVKANGYTPGGMRNIGKYKVINPLKIALPDFEDPKQRKLDVRINCPVNRLDNIVYNLKAPDSLRIQFPEDIEINSKYGNYSAAYSKEDNAIKVTERFLLKSNDIPISNYSEFYLFIESIENYKKQAAILLL